MEILRRVKQDDPLSLLLFNVCMEPLLHAVEEKTEDIKINEKSRIPILTFADDIVLLGKDKREAHGSGLPEEPGDEYLWRKMLGVSGGLK